MLVKKVENYINEYRLLEQSDRVVVGLSGGADSVCLLLLLHELSSKIGYKLYAAHVNHMIRGSEADEDEEFVRMLCDRLGVELFVSKIDVPQYAAERGLSKEEAGRDVRYREFRKIAATFDIDTSHAKAKIAVAHNKDDQVETILFNIIRGTSLAGLGGMKPISGDIIRPLLDVSRREIEDYLKKMGQDFSVDSTNLEEEYTRNKLRNRIIPLIKEINPSFGDRLIDLAKSAKDADDITTKAARHVIDECLKSDAIKEKSIYLSIADLAGTKKDITARHVKSVSALEEKNVGAEAHLPYGIIAKKEYDGIKLYKDGLGSLKKALKKAKIVSYNGEEIPNIEYKKWFDYDKIESKLTWRYRGKGDKISLGNSCHKKLKDYMIDKKIPKEKRDEIPLLADGKNIVWVLGDRISSDYKVTKDTKKIIIIDVGEG